MKVADLSELLAVPALEEHLSAMETILDETIRVENHWLAEPAARVVAGGGKRLRPIIAIATAVAGGAAVSDEVLQGAAALELVHVGSLVHDDIMDSAASRRGVETVNAREGINHAVLVGDFLLARAGQLASTISAEVSHALATAIVRLCDGQSLETGYLFRADRTRAAYEQSIAGKTSALMHASCRIGALAGQLPPPVVEAVSAYGTDFGMAFQIIDDVLDLVSTAEAMGKPVGNDLREGVYTLPVLLLLGQQTGSWLRDGLVPGIQQSTIDSIVETIEAEGTLSESIDVVRSYNRRAAAALDGLDRTPAVDGLRALPDAYLDWALREKAAGHPQLLLPMS